MVLLMWCQIKKSDTVRAVTSTTEYFKNDFEIVRFKAADTTDTTLGTAGTGKHKNGEKMSEKG